MLARQQMVVPRPGKSWPATFSFCRNGLRIPPCLPRLESIRVRQSISSHEEIVLNTLLLHAPNETVRKLPAWFRR